ncbi:MAG: hypothetical protein AAFP26_01975 [Planctomycetota bacterium]
MTPPDWVLTIGFVAGLLMVAGGMATMGRRGHTPVAAARGLSVPTRLLFGIILLLAGFQVAVHCVPASWGLRVAHMRVPLDRLGLLGALVLVGVLVSLGLDRAHSAEDAAADTSAEHEPTDDDRV